MTHNTHTETTGASDSQEAPPLFLRHYFAERTEPPDAPDRPPGPRARIAARRGNLIILEFAAPLQKGTCRAGQRRPKSLPGKSLPGKSLPGKSLPGKSLPGKSLLARACDALLLLLFLASLLACLAAFRF